MSSYMQIEPDQSIRGPAWSKPKYVEVKNRDKSVSWKAQGLKIRLESSPWKPLECSEFSSSGKSCRYYYFRFKKFWKNEYKYATVLGVGNGYAVEYHTEENPPEPIKSDGGIKDQRIFYLDDENLVAAWNPDLRLNLKAHKNGKYRVEVTDKSANASKWKIKEDEQNKIKRILGEFL